MITDLDMLTLALLLFLWVILFALSLRISGLFAVLAGIVGAYTAWVIFQVTSNVILSAVFGGMAVMTMIVGVLEDL